MGLERGERGVRAVRGIRTPDVHLPLSATDVVQALAARALYREYRSGTKAQPFAYEKFIQHLKDRGYALQEDGMIAGLMLSEDFVALVQADKGEPLRGDGSENQIDQADEHNQTVKLCLGGCARLMLHSWVDGQWICSTCTTPSLAHVYASYRPGERAE